MKTAEEWRAQLDLPNIREVVHLPWERWIKSIQKDAERSGYERGVREASEAFGWVLAEDARKSILSLLTKKEDAK